MKRVKKIWEVFLEILFPPLCLRCRGYLESTNDKDYLLCRPCFSEIPIYKTVYYGPKISIAAVSSYDNDSVRKLLHALKYNRFFAVDLPIRKLINKYLDSFDLPKVIKDDSIIIPIPLHKKRQRQRGFNQAEHIANILGEILGVPVKNDFLFRTKNNPRQTTRETKESRLYNVRGVFDIKNENLLKDTSVILVDDIYTTGATMNEASKVLRKAGVKNILGFVIAKTG